MLLEEVKSYALRQCTTDDGGRGLIKEKIKACP